MFRFEIEKKLREAKRKENQRQKVTQTATASVSQRSKDRRKVVEDKKDNKKMSALQDLKARREERKRQGDTAHHSWWILFLLYTVPQNICPLFYPHMLIGKVWIYHFLLFVILCVHTVTDFSGNDKDSASKFAWWFIGVLCRESSILRNFVPPEAQNRTTWPATRK